MLRHGFGRGGFFFKSRNRYKCYDRLVVYPQGLQDREYIEDPFRMYEQISLNS